MKATDVRAKLEPWVAEILADPGERMTILEVARAIWHRHETDLKSHDQMFYTWQYEMRWAADSLIRKGKVEKTRAGWKAL